MYKVLTNSQMREADAYTINIKGIPSKELMLRAGLAIADEVERVYLKRNAHTVLVVCGTGNNGGDGFVCAEELKKRNVAVKVYAIDGKLSADCAREKSVYSGEYSGVVAGDIIVDCIFGTGLAREITGKYAEIITAINNAKSYIISADIPSGISGDSGMVLGCAVRADLTVAIAEYKVGHFLSDGLDYCGKIVKKDIGITCPQTDFAIIYEENDLKTFFPKRARNSHKGTFGSANIIGGSEKYIGAAALAVNAALQSGCGYVKLTTAPEVKCSLAPVFPQVIFNETFDLEAQCIAIGSGSGVSRELYDKIKYILLNYRGTLIIDADGLNSVSEYGVDTLNSKGCRVVITPHVKEFSRLTGKTVREILADPINCAQKFARDYGIIVVLKSASTVICDGEHTVVNVRGNTALSKGGSGDMLTGFMCGCIARGLTPFNGAICATNSLGISAELSSELKTEYCVTADDIIKNLFLSVKRLTE